MTLAACLVIVGWKPILYSLFWTLSGISPANCSRSGQSRYTCTGQWPTTFTKFWACSVKCGRNGGLKSVPDSCVFFVSNTSWLQQLRNGRFSPNLATTR